MYLTWPLRLLLPTIAPKTMWMLGQEVILNSSDINCGPELCGELKSIASPGPVWLFKVATLAIALWENTSRHDFCDGHRSISLDCSIHNSWFHTLWFLRCLFNVSPMSPWEMLERHCKNDITLTPVLQCLLINRYVLPCFKYNSILLGHSWLNGKRFRLVIWRLWVRFSILVERDLSKALNSPGATVFTTHYP